MRIRFSAADLGITLSPQVIRPEEISGMAFRVRPDTGVFQDTAGTIVSAIGDPVGRINDLGPSLLHQTQPTAGNRPSLVTSAFKGQPALRFTAASQHFLSNVAFQLTSARAAGTWVLAFASNNAGTQTIVSPKQHALGFTNDNGALYSTHHGGNVEYANFSYPSVPTGKLVLAIYQSINANGVDRIKMRVNRVPRTMTFNGAPITNNLYAVAAGFKLGNHDTAANSFFNGDLLEAVFYTRELDYLEVAGLEEYFKQRYFALTTGNVHCIGDSLTKGYPDHTVDGLDYVTRLGVLLGGSWAAQNTSTVAYSIGLLENSAETVTTPDRNEWRDRVNGGLGDIVIHQGGTNNLYPATHNQTAAQAIAELTTSITNRHRRGFRALATTVPPLGPQGDLTAAQLATFESRRLEYNSRVRAKEAGNDDTVDWASRLTDPFGPLFYSGDHLHLSAAGNQAVAELSMGTILQLP